MSDTPILDGRLGPHRGPSYPVQIGPESITSQQFQALSSTATQHTYTVITPSLNTIVDRNVTWRSTFVLQFDVVMSKDSAATSATRIGVPGTDWALAAYPLNRLTASQAVTINDASIQMSSQQVMQHLLRLQDSELSRSWQGCPTQLDQLAYTPDGLAMQCNPYGPLNTANVGARDLPNEPLPAGPSAMPRARTWFPGAALRLTPPPFAPGTQPLVCRALPIL